ncbi:exocyst complex component Sec6-domain-containing protein [Zopfochytrium polystomum]|nr:exocyst complex component Sec6-domain-containing protein [Zopfochytrium polystomum]
MELESEAIEAAIVRVQELLRHPDDLVKLGALRKKMAAERASIDAQLRTAVELQLEDAQSGLNNLDHVKAATAQVRKNLTGIQALWDNPSGQIKNYEQIKKISRTHQNFLATKEMVLQFQKLNSQVERLQGLLQEDARRGDGSSENLLYIHYQLQQLETFKCTTMARSSGASADLLVSLQSYFRPLDALVEAFETHLWKLVERTIELVKNNRFTTIIRIAKIIEAEERLDDQASLAEAATPMAVSPSNTAPPPDILSMSTRQIKSYRIKFLDTIRESISTQIRTLYETEKSDLTQLLVSAETIIDDLTLVHDSLEPRFPKKYNIFLFFVLEYHRSIYDMVNKIITSNVVEAGSILALLKWVRDYYTNMNGRLGVGEELLEPRLLDDREEELILEYIKLVRQKLGEWLNNLLNTETRDFDGTQMYLLSGSVIVFQMFNQQLDVVSGSSRGALMYDVIIECCTALEEYQKAWTKTLETEVQRFFEGPTKHGDAPAEGLPEYIIALANDAMRGTEFAEVMVGRVESLMSTTGETAAGDAALVAAAGPPGAENPYKPLAISRIKGVALDGFMKLSRRCYALMIDIILRDVVPVLLKFHCNEWYEHNGSSSSLPPLVKYVVGTLDDYLTDFQEHMQEYLFSKFVSELQDRLLVLYLETFRNKGAKFRVAGSSAEGSTTVERMKSDLDAVVELFSRFKGAKRVKSAFEVIERVIGVIESNPRLVFLDFYKLWKAYPDVPMTFVEDLLQRRDDLDRTLVREVMEQCRTKVAEEKEKNQGKEWPATLFAKLAK